MSENLGESRIREIVKELKESGMRCYCDLDNWQPEGDTGHSWVCPIHKTAKERRRKEVADDRRKQIADWAKASLREKYEWWCP